MRKVLGGLVATATVWISSAAPAAAQEFDNDPPAGFNAVLAIIVIGFVVTVGMSIYKFVRVREMGINRGLSPKDATTTAMFSDDVGTAALTLRDEVDGDTDVEARLEKLGDLLDKGLITEAEAAQRRAEILDDL